MGIKHILPRDAVPSAVFLRCIMLSVVRLWRWGTAVIVGLLRNKLHG